MQRQVMAPQTPLILLTRPADASARFAVRLAGLCPKPEVMISPLQEVRFLDWVRPRTRADAMIFTSQNAVAAAQRAGITGLAYCVGNQTTQAAAQAGFDAVSAEGEANALVTRIMAEGPKVLWHLHGVSTRGDVAGRLRAAGFEVDEAVVYETADLPLLPAAQAALDGTRPVIVPLFSPKSAQRAAAAMGGARAPLVVLSLSSAVDRAAAAIPAVRRLVARRPDADGMMEIMIQALNQGALS